MENASTERKLSDMKMVENEIQDLKKELRELSELSTKMVETITGNTEDCPIMEAKSESESRFCIMKDELRISCNNILLERIKSNILTVITMTESKE